MKNLGVSLNLYLLLLSSLLFFQRCSQTSRSELSETDQKQEYYTVEDFRSVKKIDTHIHMRTENPDFIEQAIKDNFKLLNIDVYKAGGASVEDQRTLAIKHLNTYAPDISYATTFSLANWDSEQWQQETIKHLQESFKQGAIGVKVWKNIGMELRDKNNNFVMIDHPRFDPVFDFIAKNGITLLSHQGEPKDCWLPLDEMTFHKHYFSKHPEYHMYLHPEYPSYEDQIIARDNMLRKNPDLKVVSVHLASLEWSVDEMAKRLDKFPNMAIDIAARIKHLQLQAKEERQKTYDFFIKYQDRLLYATDFVITDAMDSAEMKQTVHDKWVDDWRFFTTDEKITTPGIKGEYRGLKLPRNIIDKIYRENAEAWFSGMKNESEAGV